ncbi:hypothetical protein J1614_003260 [Plenodomus biglobosus]|nr:hypothetical protein J1614_003260 [Plenodomus biglobosus]
MSQDQRIWIQKQSRTFADKEAHLYASNPDLSSLFSRGRAAILMAISLSHITARSLIHMVAFRFTTTSRSTTPNSLWPMNMA